MTPVPELAPKPNPRRHALVGCLACALPLVLVLPGCANKTPSAADAPKPAQRVPSAAPAVATPSAPSSAAPALERSATPSPSPLTTERQWLQSWFVGTPVVIAERQDGAISIDVPKEFCFAEGDSKIKAPLVAVLDKVAQSLRRMPTARLAQVAGPEDQPAAKGAPANGTNTLALQRANKMRGHLVSRGVSAARLGPASSTVVAAVQLRLDVAPAP
jgi:outer membrane protein OmpA-like peptidoglycan-associated protein